MSILFGQLSSDEEQSVQLDVLDLIDVPYHELSLVQSAKKEESKSAPASGARKRRPRPAIDPASDTPLKRSSNRPPLPRDSSGQTILPARLRNGVIRALGEVVHDRPKYHSDRYIFPVGFESTREAPSVRNPGLKTTYTSRILDGGEMPLFQVVAEDDPETVYAANTSSGAWAPIMKAVSARGSNVVSGPDQYGLSNRSVIKSIQDLPGAELCANYSRME